MRHIYARLASVALCVRDHHHGVRESRWADGGVRTAAWATLNKIATLRRESLTVSGNITHGNSVALKNENREQQALLVPGFCNILESEHMNAKRLGREAT